LSVRHDEGIRLGVEIGCGHIIVILDVRWWLTLLLLLRSLSLHLADVLGQRRHRRRVTRLILEVLLVERSDTVGAVLGILGLHNIIRRQRTEPDRQATVLIVLRYT
jgi:hypothetical protein